MEKNNPAISVIVPIYNAESFLHRCLSSLISQTFSDWEAICVNDGSGDNSWKILEEYAARDPRFKIISKPNSGVSDTRNIALGMAVGEYVLYLDADDFIHPQTMEITHSLAVSQDADMVAFRHDIKLYKELRERIHRGLATDNVVPSSLGKRYILSKIPKIKTNNVIFHVTERTHRIGLWWIKHCYPCMNLYRRELVDGIKFKTDIKVSEDFPWWSELILRRPKTVITKLPLYYYIPNPTSALSSASALHLIINNGRAITYAFERYKQDATHCEMFLWQREFAWPFLISAFRKVKYLSASDDIKIAKDIFIGLQNLGVLNAPATIRSRKYRRRILKFINQ